MSRFLERILVRLATKVTVMRMAKITTQGYQAIDSQHVLAVKRFRKDGGAYVRLWVEDPDKDLFCTFDPLLHEQAGSLHTRLPASSCHIWERWKTHFEADKRECSR